ncbi:hypothetical protein FOA52_007632 [Chlamydomonas sp. UWO 241]|nr:hypothetical protein FOA52_007632 [Chlamydomonas sp. UWO 241]
MATATPMSLALTRRGAAVLKDALRADEIAAVKKELTVSPVSHGQGQGQVYGRKYEIYLESRSKLYVPKSYALKRWPDAHIRAESSALPLDPDLAFAGSLRPEQLEPVRCVLDACLDPRRAGGVLNVACGGGKTTMALHVLRELGLRTLIVVHKDFLLEQWRERIAQFLPGARVGLIKAGVVDVAHRDIVMASLQSLAMKDYDPEVFRGLGTLIVDEVHHTSAEVFNRALFKTSLRYTIGLTATLDRKDGLSRVFVWHLGDVVYRSGGRVDADVRVLPHTVGGHIAQLDPHPSRAVNQLCDDPVRNASIARLLNTGIEAHRKTLVLSDRVRHLRLLASMVDQKTHGIYVGGMKAAALKACEDKQVIFATYAIASEGYDQRGLDTLVLASPRSDVRSTTSSR